MAGSSKVMGRGKKLCVDLKACEDEALVAEWNGFSKKFNDIGNSYKFGPLKNKREEYLEQKKAVHDRKEEVRQLIEANVGAAYYTKNGIALDENAKRMKLQHKQVTKAITLLENVASSSEVGSANLEAALESHKKIKVELFGEGAANKVKGEQVAKKAAAKLALDEKKAAANEKAAEKAAAEEAADPEKYSLKRKAAEEEAALKAAESEKKKAKAKAEKEAEAAEKKAAAAAKAAAKLVEKANAGKTKADQAEAEAAAAKLKAEKAKAEKAEAEKADNEKLVGKALCWKPLRPPKNRGVILEDSDSVQSDFS